MEVAELVVVRSETEDCRAAVACARRLKKAAVTWRKSTLAGFRFSLVAGGGGAALAREVRKGSPKLNKATVKWGLSKTRLPSR